MTSVDITSVPTSASPETIALLVDHLGRNALSEPIAAIAAADVTTKQWVEMVRSGSTTIHQFLTHVSRLAASRAAWVARLAAVADALGLHKSRPGRRTRQTTT